MSGLRRESKKGDLALALAQGHTVSAWARAHQVPKRTAYRWAADPKVRRAVEAIRRRALERAVGVMTTRATWAAKKIYNLGKTAGSESVKLSAPRAILSDMMSVSQFSTLEGRAAEVEENLRERQQTGNADWAG
jgi:hypothetical protein